MRWRHALDAYIAQQTQETARTAGRVAFNCVIDVSGSMEGTKLDAVKLGLCAVVASLGETDVINISSFSDRHKSITRGFREVSFIRRELPALLESVDSEGATACFDAAIKGSVESI